MSDERYVDPTRESFAVFKSLPRDTPIHMLNLLQFRGRADYPTDHPDATRGLSGAEAYREYGRASAPVLARVGGEVVWRGRMEAMVIGPQDKTWDAAFIAAYPSAAAFLAMVTDLEYKSAVVHRQAAVLTSRLIRFEPLETDGRTFS